MQLPSFGDVAAKRIHLEKLMDEAKAQRSQYLKESSRHPLHAIGRAAAVLGFVLRGGLVRQGRAEAGRRR